MATIKVKGNGPKRRNPLAAAVRENKCFAPRIVSAKTNYSRKSKHKGKDLSNGY